MICEEVLLRQEFEPQADCADLLDRFPQWRQQLEAILDCHQALGQRPQPHTFPQAGETLGDFRLLSELGRGGRGRVYLAAQNSLGNRHVVLKVTPLEGCEHLTLARLQHTHIVPLYAVCDDFDRQVRCAFLFWRLYFGESARRLRPLPFTIRTGANLTAALRELCVESASPLTVEGPACKFLEMATYVQAICWIGACLADALDAAAQRGLVHLDVKPSNLLLTADAQPMLLDFHLSQSPITANGPAPVWLGGTLPYMAPEQRTALEAVRAGRPAPVSVDGRADIYALGLVLYEALGGAAPTDTRPGHDLRRQNPAVSRGLADILERCLALSRAIVTPVRAELAADLARHLAMSRWRRQPQSAGTMGQVASASASNARAPASCFRADRCRAPSVLHCCAGMPGPRRPSPKPRRFWKGPRTRSGRRRPARPGRRRSLPTNAGVVARLQALHWRAVRLQAAGELHQIAEQLRGLRGAAPLSQKEKEELIRRCQRVWEERKILTNLLSDSSEAGDRQMRADLADILTTFEDLRRDNRIAPKP